MLPHERAVLSVFGGGGQLSGRVPEWIPFASLFAAALLTALAATPLARKIAIQLGAIDKPTGRRVNKVPVPRMGGIAIFAGIAAAFIVQYIGTMHFGWPVVLVPWLTGCLYWLFA